MRRTSGRSRNGCAGAFGLPSWCTAARLPARLRRPCISSHPRARRRQCHVLATAALGTGANTRRCCRAGLAGLCRARRTGASARSPATASRGPRSPRRRRHCSPTACTTRSASRARPGRDARRHRARSVQRAGLAAPSAAEARDQCAASRRHRPGRAEAAHARAVRADPFRRGGAIVWCADPAPLALWDAHDWAGLFLASARPGAATIAVTRVRPCLVRTRAGSAASILSTTKAHCRARRSRSDIARRAGDGAVIARWPEAEARRRGRFAAGAAARRPAGAAPVAAARHPRLRMPAMRPPLSIARRRVSGRFAPGRRYPPPFAPSAPAGRRRTRHGALAPDGNFSRSCGIFRDVCASCSLRRAGGCARSRRGADIAELPPLCEPSGRATPAAGGRAFRSR